MNKENRSLWAATSPESSYSSLKGKIEVDVAVVGGGITGLTAALLLKRAGKKVAVIEKSRIATGESGQTTAHLTEVVDTRFHKIASDFGKERARAVAESSRAAIAQIAQLVTELKIDCAFERVPGFLYAESLTDMVELKRELKAMQQAGIGAQWVKEVPVPFESRGAIMVEDQAQFHPGNYLEALAKAVDSDGSHVFERSRVVELRDGEPCRLKTENGSIVAREIIVATNNPISNRVTMQTKIANYRTYAIAARIENIRSRLSAGLFWDNQDPYHYTRLHGDYVLIGGEDHKTGTIENTGASYEKLIEYAHAKWGVSEIAYRWSGQITRPVDGLPYIGRAPLSRHEYVATGYTGNGMTFGTIAGMLLSDEVLGRANSWSKLYDATRINLRASAFKYISENKDYLICMIKGRIEPPEAKSLSEVGVGEGKIVEIAGKKVAVYHDEIGTLHALSPVCTHLGCHVSFNRSERTWDCPCHGSRFGVDGRVLNGPATVDLKPVEISERPPQQLEKRKKRAKKHKQRPRVAKPTGTAA